MMQSDSIAFSAPAETTPGADSSVQEADAVAVVPVMRGDTVVPVRTMTGLRPLWTPDSVPADTVAADSLAARPVTFGILLKGPEVPEVAPNPDAGFGMSYILGSLAILFFVIGLRFRNNVKYVTTMLRNMVEVRMRSNVFDETVRETSFLLLLNLLWSCSAGIILWSLLGYTLPATPADTMYLPSLHTHQAVTMAICMGVGVLYTCLMALAYITVGTVFSDALHARLWLKGFAAGQGLLSFIYFPLSLLLLFYPQCTEMLLWVALATFLMTKIVFIWKGFRIFFTQISSWVLFLYYLCSLEIVPLILTYLAAWWLCSLI